MVASNSLEEATPSLQQERRENQFLCKNNELGRLSVPLSSFISSRYLAAIISFEPPEARQLKMTTHSLPLAQLLLCVIRNELVVILLATITRRFSSFSGVIQNCLMKNSSSNSFSSFKPWNSPFECLSIKICRTQNNFPLMLLFLRLKCKQSNSDCISFLTEILAIVF